jgi:methionyl-tRNA formyltransferase
MTRIIFMGTPEFAVPVLDALSTRYSISAVYTRPDRPAGRGRKIAESPVKQFAREHGLTVEQPASLRKAENIERLRAYAPDLIIVAAYGLILPQAVLDIPPLGCINTHASLLPRHRGASPITAAILAGDSETGITLMKMDAGLDTGPIIAVDKLLIANDETTATLSEKLAHLAAALLIRTLPRWLANEITPQPQDESRATHTRLIKATDGLIDWTKPAVEIERLVRAYTPWPGAHTHYAGKLLKVLRSRVLTAEATAEPGRVIKIGNGVAVGTGKELLGLQEIQLEGKRTLSAEEFVRGHPDLIGVTLE